MSRGRRARTGSLPASALAPGSLPTKLGTNRRSLENLKKGKATQFKKGQVANPNGRPPTKRWRLMLEAIEEEQDPRTKRTLAEDCLRTLAKAAKRGDWKAFEIMLRINNQAAEQEITINDQSGLSDLTPEERVKKLARILAFEQRGITEGY